MGIAHRAGHPGSHYVANTTSGNPRTVEKNFCWGQRSARRRPTNSASGLHKKIRRASRSAPIRGAVISVKAARRGVVASNQPTAQSITSTHRQSLSVLGLWLAAGGKGSVVRRRAAASMANHIPRLALAAFRIRVHRRRPADPNIFLWRCLTRTRDRRYRRE